MGFFSRLQPSHIISELQDIASWGKIVNSAQSRKIFYQLRKLTAKGYVIDIGKWGSPIYLRNNISDKAIFRQVFFWKQYDPLLEKVRHPKLIIDAGANIGMASRFFNFHYPEAIIYAIEPESENFKQLLLNTTDNPSVKCFQAALWFEKTRVMITNPETLSAGFMVQEADAGIETVTIPELLHLSGEDSIDILKIDIEGAEKEILENNAHEWLPKVKTMVVELHDQMKPGTGESLVKALSGYRFSMYTFHENIFIDFAE